MRTSAASRQKPAPGELCLDHVGHFVLDLDAAAAALEALGFTLTPASEQTTRAPDGTLVPAGTRFRAAMLGQGYIELIQPVADTRRTRRMRDRMRGGGAAPRPGVHLASFGTPSAPFEHERLARHDFTPLALVHHERRVTGGLARYQVAHVPYEKMAEGRVEYVEHETPEVLWEERWVSGFNAECALAMVFIVSAERTAAAARWARFSGLLPAPTDECVRMRLARGQILLGEEGVLGLSARGALSSIAAYGLALDQPVTLLPGLRRLGCAVRESKPGVWIADLPAALGGSWVIGTRAALETFPAA